MDAKKSLNATTAGEKIHTESSPLGPSRSGDSDGNAALYGRGRRCTDRIARAVGRGEDRGATLRRVAADEGLDVEEVQSDVRFTEAADRIIKSAGPEAGQLIMVGGPHLSREKVLRIANTHPARRTFAMECVARGQDPFDRSIAWKAPPFVTTDYREARDRIICSVELLDRVADGLEGIPPGDWPPIDDLRVARSEASWLSYHAHHGAKPAQFAVGRASE